MVEINKQKLPLLALFAVALLALLFAGCTAPQDISFDSHEYTVDPTVPPGCESCACFVCERGDLATPGDVGAAGLTPDELASSFGGTLKGGHCWFQKCDADLKKMMADNNKIANKALMIGAGSSGPEFMKDSKYCPMLDESCYSGTAGGRERWQNILRSAGVTDVELAPLGWLEEYEASTTKPPLISDFGTGSFIAGKGLSIDDFTCLFSGSKGQSYLADASTADTRLFCSSGSCNKQYAYRSMCRREMSGDGQIDYTPPATGGQYPADEVPCECRLVGNYEAGKDLYWTPGHLYPPAGSPPLFTGGPYVGEIWCHSDAHSDSFSSTPVSADCSVPSSSPGTCVAYADAALTNCIEWKLSDTPGSTGACKADNNGQLDLNSYGICESCTPAMELVPISGEGADGTLPTDIKEYLSDSDTNDPLEWRHNDFLSRNIMPVLYVRKWADASWAEDVAGYIYTKGLYPSIFALDSSQLGLAGRIKFNCPPEFLDITDSTGTVITIQKQACLVSITDDGTDLPIPVGSLDNVDLLEAEKTFDCANAPAMVDQLVARAKAVQAQYGPTSTHEKSIGWLLTAHFMCSTGGEAAKILLSKQSLDKLSNAGFIGIIAQGLDTPYTAISIDPATNDASVTPNAAAPDSFNFFEGCADYYNGTKQTYYLRQNPQQCQCVPCDPTEGCTALSLECGSSGLQCLGLDGLQMPSTTIDMKCQPGCLPFPDITKSPTEPTFDCITIDDADTAGKLLHGCFANGYTCSTTDPALLTQEDKAQGCGVICKMRTDGFDPNDPTKLNRPISHVPPRGIVDPEPGYDSENTEGHARYTPTNCYMQDSNNKFYKYQRSQVANPSSGEFVIFDRKGEPNECGRMDITSLLGDTAPCSIPEELPAVVIK